MTPRRPSPEVPPPTDPARSMPAATPTSGDGQPRHVRRRLRGHQSRLQVLPALVAVALVAAACSSSPAATSAPSTTTPAHHHTGRHRGAGIVGTLAAVSASSLTVNVHGSTHTFTLTSTTRYRQGHHNIAASTIAPGERVRVRTATNGSATVVAILPATATGTIVTLGTHGFTLHTPHGATLTVTATPSATYRDGTRTVTASALKPGQTLHIQGQPGPNGTFTASRITIVPAA